MTQFSLSRLGAGVLTLALAACLVMPAAWARRDIQLHVEVTDEDTGDMRMNLHLPLDSIDAILEILHEEVDFDVHQDFRHHGMDLRKLYLALRDQDLSNFLEVNDGGDHVRIWKDDEAFQVLVEREDEPRPVAKVYLPLQVMDALFSGPDEAMLNFSAALEELRNLAPLTLVEANDDHETVRVWVD
jgi:hypothetical protein